MTADSSYPTPPAAIETTRDSLWENLRVMGRVIFALMIRDSRTRYGKHDLGYLWAIINPLVQLIVLVIVFTLFGRKVPVNASLPVFFTLGILPYQFWHEATGRGGTAAASNVPLLSYPQVKLLDIVISRVLLDAATMTIVFIIFIIGLNFTTGEPYSSWFSDPFQLVLAFSSLLYFSYSFAVFSSGLSRVFHVWPQIFGYMSRPLWFFSGIFFTLQNLDKGVQKVALYNPVAHVLEWIKSAAMPGFHSTVYSPTYILCVATGVLAIGLTIEWLWALTGHPEEGE